jgi:hypothetical protein
LREGDWVTSNREDLEEKLWRIKRFSKSRPGYAYLELLNDREESPILLLPASSLRFKSRPDKQGYIGIPLEQDEARHWLLCSKGEGNGGWIKSCRLLRKLLNHKCRDLLSFLMDWCAMKVMPTMLARNGGYFYCPNKTILDRDPFFSRATLKSAFDTLERNGYIRLGMKYASRRKPYKNHRMIFICYTAIEKAIDAMRKAENGEE